MTTSVAPLLPKLRGNFAEFLNKSSPDRLRIFFSSTCVGLRYGYLQKFSSFSRQRGFMHISFLIRLSSRLRLTTCVLHYKPALPLEHTFPFVLHTILLCHCIINFFGSTGISTCCPSSTPFGLDLGPDLPWGDEPSPGNLRLSTGMILTSLSLLMPAFSLLYSPHLLPVMLLPVYIAPLPIWLPYS